MIYRFDIPISNYEGDAVFFKHIYIESNHSPDKDDLVKLLTKLNDNYLQFPEYLGEEKEALDIVQSCKDIPYLGGRLIGTNTFVDHPKFGRQPLSVQIIKPYRI